MNLKILMIMVVGAFLFLFEGMPASAQNVMETTYVKRNGPTIVVRAVGPVEVLDVEPSMEMRKGKSDGQLNLQVILKNKAREARTFQLFGQGRTTTGGWLGGAAKAPQKGRLAPGKQTTAKVRTSYEGKSMPREIRLDVF